MEFKVFQKELELQSRGWVPTFHDVSKEIMEIVAASGVKNGTVTIASHHTTCSVMIQECSHDIDSFDLEYLQHDLLDIMRKMIPDFAEEHQYRHPGPIHTQFGRAVGEPLRSYAAGIENDVCASVDRRRSVRGHGIELCARLKTVRPGAFPEHHPELCGLGLDPVAGNGVRDVRIIREHQIIVIYAEACLSRIGVSVKRPERERDKHRRKDERRIQRFADVLTFILV